MHVPIFRQLADLAYNALVPVALRRWFSPGLLLSEF